MQKQDELLAIFVPGPNEYYAMPDMETATDMVARHNAALENEPKMRDMITRLGLDPEQMKYLVCKWPYSDAEHAEDLAVFLENIK